MVQRKLDENRSINMIKLLKKLIFAKEEPKQEQQWTIQNNGWEQSKNDYNKRMRLGETLI